MSVKWCYILCCGFVCGKFQIPVLSELVQRAGQVVTREELQERIWENGTNVDFDHSLGTAINKIRDPVWSSDSRWVYADAFIDPGQPVYRVSVPDGRVEELGGIGNLHSTEFSDLLLCGLFQDGTVAVRVRLTTATCKRTASTSTGPRSLL